MPHRRSTGETLVDLFDEFHQSGFLMSLGFTKAFDLLDPWVTRAALLHVGWDARPVFVCLQCWPCLRGCRLVLDSLLRWLAKVSHLTSGHFGAARYIKDHQSIYYSLMCKPQVRDLAQTERDATNRPA